MTERVRSYRYLTAEIFNKYRVGIEGQEKYDEKHFVALRVVPELEVSGVTAKFQVAPENIVDLLDQIFR